MAAVATEFGACLAQHRSFGVNTKKCLLTIKFDDCWMVRGSGTHRHKRSERLRLGQHCHRGSTIEALSLDAGCDQVSPAGDDITEWIASGLSDAFRSVHNGNAAGPAC